MRIQKPTGLDSPKIKVAIVGGRTFPNETLVRDYIRQHVKEDMIVISGGAFGVDTWAVGQAGMHGIETVVFMPEIKAGMRYHEKVQEFYRRNRQIAEACDCLVAFTDAPRGKGGTWVTIGYAIELHRVVTLYNSKGKRTEIA